MAGFKIWYKKMRKTELIAILKNYDLNYSSMAMEFYRKGAMYILLGNTQIFLNPATVLQVLHHSLHQIPLLQQMRHWLPHI